jgi:hypothetical protein
MNPVENEAVLAEALRQSDVPLELVDVSDKLPNLKRRPGMLDWVVSTKQGVFCRKPEDAHEESSVRKVPSLFAQPDLKALGIERW